MTQGCCILHIAAEFLTQSGGPTLKPYAVIGLELCAGTKSLDYIAGVIAQGGRQTYDYRHKRPEHDVLKAVPVFMLQQMS